MEKKRNKKFCLFKEYVKNYYTFFVTVINYKDVHGTFKNWPRYTKIRSKAEYLITRSTSEIHGTISLNKLTDVEPK